MAISMMRRSTHVGPRAHFLVCGALEKGRLLCLPRFSALQQKMQGSTSHFKREYLRGLLDEMVMDGKEVIVRSQYKNLIGAITQKLDTPSEVPSFGLSWLPGTDSNHQPSG